MAKPKNSKATGDKNSGYSNILKINNTTYVSNKDKLYLHLSKVMLIGLDFLELAQSLRSDFKRLKPHISNIRKIK
jgi:hypothetical protein